MKEKESSSDYVFTYDANRDYATYSIDETLRELTTSASGLSTAQAGKRLHTIGANEIPEQGRRTVATLLLRQFKSVLVAILLLATILSFLTQHYIDAYVILVVVLINAGLGFIQEWRAEHAVISLRKFLRSTARVVRDGETQSIDAGYLVPGDIMILEEGDKIPADGRLIEAKNIRTIEAALTGESLPLSKTTEIVAQSLALADKKNMVWKGTFVAGGYGKVVVTATGLHTAIGKIATSLQAIRVERSHFQRKIDKLGRQMALASVVSAVALFVIAKISLNLPWYDLLLISVAAMVSVIPEGLPAILAIVLAIGAQRMTRRNAIVREFTATETLGAVTTIITDKTGTITANALTVRKLFVCGEPDIDVTGEGWFPAGNFLKDGIVMDTELSKPLSRLLHIAAHCNNAAIRHIEKTNEYQLMGDPTEGALLVLARKAGIHPPAPHALRKDDLPFSSTLKLRASILHEEDKQVMMVIGAPEKIVSCSAQVVVGDAVEPMSGARAYEIKSKIEEWSSQAMRVVALAYRDYDHHKIHIDDISHLVFVGLAGMFDPPRKEVKEAVRHCKRAGIRVVMATGDHISTAVAIARSVGIISKDDHELVALSEDQLLQLDEQEFDDVITRVNVFARLTPDMKLRIAGRLQAQGQLIAMTGDGVNDAPALKKADVGVAMGIMGTDVARDAAKIILADDNFSTIVNAIEEGRIVFTNARLASFYLVTTNFAEIITLIVAVVWGLPIPLTATQILWLNLVTDSIGVMAIAVERGHGDALDEKPLRKDEKIISGKMMPFFLINVIIMVTLSMAVYAYFLPDGLEKARSAAFIVMSFTQLFNLYNMRSLRKSLAQIGFFTNRYVTLAFLSSAVITLLITSVPFFKDLFDFGTIRITEFFVFILLSSLVLWITELFKYIRRSVPLVQDEAD